jgi:hypothetical protein
MLHDTNFKNSHNKRIQSILLPMSRAICKLKKLNKLSTIVRWKHIKTLKQAIAHIGRKGFY